MRESRKSQCGCGCTKDKRAKRCRACRMKAGARLGTGQHGIGRSLNRHGYVILRTPGSRAARASPKYEHRYVMEQHLGRALERDEHVHHKNGDRQDNRLENLELLSASEHARHHLAVRWGNHAAAV